MKPGVYYGLTDGQYDQIPALRSSTLKLLSTHTPAHVKWELDHPSDETDAQTLGSAAHIAVLEPDRFEELVALSPYNEFKSNIAKAWKKEREAEGMYVLKEPAYKATRAMVDGVRRNPLARELLGGKGQNEVSIVWDDILGMRCKARLDRSSDSLQDVIDRELDVVEPMKDVVVDRIQTDRYPAQSCCRQRLGLLGQQRPIGRQDHFTVWQRRQHLDGEQQQDY